MRSSSAIRASLRDRLSRAPRAGATAGGERDDGGPDGRGERDVDEHEPPRQVRPVLELADAPSARAERRASASATRNRRGCAVAAPGERRRARAGARQPKTAGRPDVRRIIESTRSPSAADVRAARVRAGGGRERRSTTRTRHAAASTSRRGATARSDEPARARARAASASSATTIAPASTTSASRKCDSDEQRMQVGLDRDQPERRLAERPERRSRARSGDSPPGQARRPRARRARRASESVIGTSATARFPNSITPWWPVSGKKRRPRSRASCRSRGPTPVSRTTAPVTTIA